MTTTEAKIEPGIYRNLPEHVYHGSAEWRLPSATLLKTLAASTPAHALYQLTHYTPPTPALVTGQALHALALEPNLFESRFVKADTCSAVKKSGEPCENPGVFIIPSGEWVCGVHGKGKGGRAPVGKQIITVDQGASVQAMNDAIFAHPEARDIFAVCDSRELSMVFERDGILAKSRMDMVSESAGIVADIKTCESAAPDDAAKAIENFGYYIQAGLYGIAFEERFGREMQHFVFIFVEKDPPYAVAVYELEPEAVSDGRAAAIELLHEWDACAKANSFPAYPGYRKIGRPSWARRT